jgi:signal transduction histidine kinase
LSTGNPHGQPEGKQFRLAKFFAYASFTILALASFPFSVIISQQAKDILTRSYENYALLLGENLNHQVFRNFVLPVSARYGRIRLRDPQQYELMDKIIKTTIHGFKIDLVNIYDIGKGVIAYSTDPSLVGEPAEETEGYKKASAGEDFSRLMSTDERFFGLGTDLMGGERKLRTYIPFRREGPFGEDLYVLGVFELIQDLGSEYKSIVKLQYVIFGTSVVIMALIFFALMLIVRKAEKILEDRAREQRELQVQLDQAERLAALGEMLAGVSHEIRNPLGIIRSTAELLGSMPDAAGRKNLSDVIVEESSRLNNIVTEFLDFARPKEPNLQDCELKEIISRNLGFLQPQLEKEGIEVHHNLDEKVLPLRADPNLLYRCFLNLFVNAIQAMKNGGVLSVNVTEDEETYQVVIADTGEGIDEENLGKIFNPFFSTKDQGSGLGLAIVRSIIESHGGSIRIQSAAGEGTRVAVNLPRG